MQKLTELREERALSMRELADMAGIAHNTIYRLEGGQKNARPRTIRYLAQALGVEPKVLMQKRG